MQLGFKNCQIQNSQCGQSMPTSGLNPNLNADHKYVEHLYLPHWIFNWVVSETRYNTVHALNAPQCKKLFHLVMTNPVKSMQCNLTSSCLYCKRTFVILLTVCYNSLDTVDKNLITIDHSIALEKLNQCIKAVRKLIHTNGSMLIKKRCNV